MGSRGVMAWLSIAFMMVFVCSGMAADAATDKVSDRQKEELYKQVELFSEALGIVRNEYVDQADSQKLIYGALRGAFESLDDYSEFLDPEEYREIDSETKGEFGGIGIEISMKDGLLTVIAPLAAGPAEAADVRARDRIVKIDGRMTKEISLSDAVKQMRGEPGTTIALTLWRESDDKVYDVTLKRAVIVIKGIKSSSVLEGRIGYIKLVEFQQNTPGDLDEALAGLERDGISGLILDLRNNPGGLLEVSADVAERFLPKDSPVVTVRSRTPEQNISFKSSGSKVRKAYPLVVLVNGGSASASEIVAGAIQDNKRGVIVGEKTFGKASVQTIVPLRDGSAVKLTTALYYTPKGKSIRGGGIIPDVQVGLHGKASGKRPADDIFDRVDSANDGTSGDEAALDDAQLQAAIHVLKGIKVYADSAG